MLLSYTNDTGHQVGLFGFDPEVGILTSENLAEAGSNAWFSPFTLSIHPSETVSAEEIGLVWAMSDDSGRRLMEIVRWEPNNRDSNA